MLNLKFTQGNCIKIDLNTKTIKLIERNNGILKHNVEYFLQRKLIKNMMYFYNQLTVLHSYIPQYMEKVKQEVDTSIKKEFSNLE